MTVNEIDNLLKSKVEPLASIHRLLDHWAGKLNTQREALSLEIGVWGHWDAVYPRYRLFVLSKGKEDLLIDSNALVEMNNEVDKLSDAIREKREFCRCKKY